MIGSRYKHNIVAKFTCRFFAFEPIVCFVFTQMVSQGILKYTVHGMLGERQRQSLFFFLDVVSEVLQEHHDLVDLDKLLQKMNLALALLEKDFPISIQVWIFYF